MENLKNTFTQNKNLKYYIFGLVLFIIVVVAVLSSGILNQFNSTQSSNSKNSKSVGNSESKTSSQNLKPDILSGDSNTNFYYKGMQLKLVESGILTPEIQSKAPEFCTLSKVCANYSPSTLNQKDKIDYFLAFVVTNTTNQITTNELLDDISGQNTLLVDSDGKEYTDADYSGSRYCSANPNIPSVSRDTLPGESRLVDFCFSIPSGTVVTQFKTKLNKTFLTGFDFSDKNKLTVDLKSDYHSDYSNIQFGKPELANLGDEKVIAGLKTKIISTKVQDPNELIKVIKQHNNIDNQIAIIMELENTSDKEISVEKSYDFVFNHKIGLAEKDYSYQFSKSQDATSDFISTAKLAPKEKIFMYHYFGVSQKDINLQGYHLSVIYNSASRMGSFEKNNTQWQAFSLGN